MIGGQIQPGRGIGKVLAPIGQLGVQHLATQPLSLPLGKVGILQG